MTSDNPRWRKSSYSGGQGGNCVEVADCPDGSRVLVHDTKDRTGPALRFAPGTWRSFTGQVKRSLDGPQPSAQGHPPRLRVPFGAFRGRFLAAGECPTLAVGNQVDQRLKQETTLPPGTHKTPSARLHDSARVRGYVRMMNEKMSARLVRPLNTWLDKPRSTGDCPSREEVMFAEHLAILGYGMAAAAFLNRSVVPQRTAAGEAAPVSRRLSVALPQNAPVRDRKTMPLLPVVAVWLIVVGLPWLALDPDLSPRGQTVLNNEEMALITFAALYTTYFLASRKDR